MSEWPGKNASHQLQKFNRMVKEMGLKDTIEFLQRPQRIGSPTSPKPTELRYWNPNVEGDLNDYAPGVVVFGPKTGRYYGNKVGMPDIGTAVDIWEVREAYRRWGRPEHLGKLVEDPVTRQDRETIMEFHRELGRLFGLSPEAAQSVNWHFGQNLYRHLGVSAPSYTNSDGTLKYLYEKGIWRPEWLSAGPRVARPDVLQLGPGAGPPGVLEQAGGEVRGPGAPGPGAGGRGPGAPGPPAEGPRYSLAEEPEQRRVSFEVAPGEGSRLESRLPNLYAVNETRPDLVAKITEELAEPFGKLAARHSGAKVVGRAYGPGIYLDYPPVASGNWSVTGTPEQVGRFANAMGYYADQTEVLASRIDPAGKSQGIDITSSRPQIFRDPKLLKAYWQSLRGKLPQELLSGAMPVNKGLHAGIRALDLDGSWTPENVQQIIQAARAAGEEIGVDIDTGDRRFEISSYNNDWKQNPNGETYTLRDQRLASGPLDERRTLDIHTPERDRYVDYTVARHIDDLRGIPGAEPAGGWKLSLAGEPEPPLPEAPRITAPPETRPPVSPNYETSKAKIFQKLDISDEEKVEYIRMVGDWEKANPDRRAVPFSEVQAEAERLDPQLVADLKPPKVHETISRPLWYAAKQRSNLLMREIQQRTAALQMDPPESPDARIAEEAEIVRLEKDMHGMLDVLLPVRSQDGRNLAYHRSMADTTWDPEYWVSRARRSMGLPSGATPPENVTTRIIKILNEGQAAEEAVVAKIRGTRKAGVPKEGEGTTVPPRTPEQLNREQMVERMKERLKDQIEGRIKHEQTSTASLISPEERAAFETDPEVLKLRAELAIIVAAKRAAAKGPEPVETRGTLVEQARLDLIKRLETQLKGPKLGPDPISPEERLQFERDPDVLKLRAEIAARRAAAEAPPEVLTREQMVERMKKRLKDQLAGRIRKEETPTAEFISPEERAAFEEDPEVLDLRSQLARVRGEKRARALGTQGREAKVEQARKDLIKRLESQIKGQKLGPDPVTPEERAAFDQDPEVLKLRSRLAAKRAAMKVPVTAEMRIERGIARKIKALEQQAAGVTKTPGEWALTPAERDAVNNDKRVRDARIALGRELNNLDRMGWLETFTTFRKAGFLTGAKTTLRNVGGNVSVIPMMEAARAPAAVLDMVTSLYTGHRTVQGPSARAMAQAGYAAATKGIREAVELMRRGGTLDELARMELPRERTSKVPMLDFYHKYIFRFMAAQDKVFKAYAAERSLREQAWLKAKNEKGRARDYYDNPTPEMVANSIADAEYATFNESNILTDKLSALRESWRHAETKAGKPNKAGIALATAMDIEIPFMRTPANIVKRVTEFSPGGLAWAGSGIHDAVVQKALTPDLQRKITLAMGRGMVGSALMVMGYQLAKAGLMTGIKSEEPGEAAAKEAAGRLPGSIRFGDTWHQISAFSPAGNILTIGATAYETATRPLKEEARRFWKYALIGGRTVMEQPFLKGMEGTLGFITNPEARSESYGASQAGSIVPSFVKDIATATDEVVRKPEGMAEGIMERIPGLRQQVPPRYDVLGRPMPQRLSGVFSPTMPQRAEELTDPVLNELVRQKVKISRTDRLEGESREEEDTRARLTGSLIYQMVQDAVSDPEYQALKDPEERREALDKIIRGARTDIRKMRDEDFKALPQNERIAEMDEVYRRLTQPRR